MCKDCGCSTATHPLFPGSQQKRKISGSIKPSRKITVEESLFQKNQNEAIENRKLFNQENLKVINVMSSPGSGKTTLLSNLLGEMKNHYPLAVLVGDQETSIDADRYAKEGVFAKQINTHAACHLDAKRIRENLNDLPNNLKLIVIENVGNLVCPAVFDLGEKLKVALLSTTEGEEKPLKYPVLFHDADIIVLSKCDLIDVLEYDLELVTKNIRSLNPSAPLVLCSTKTGAGISELRTTIETALSLKEDTDVLGDTSNAQIN